MLLGVPPFHATWPVAKPDSKPLLESRTESAVVPGERFGDRVSPIQHLNIGHGNLSACTGILFAADLEGSQDSVSGRRGAGGSEQDSHQSTTPEGPSACNKDYSTWTLSVLFDHRPI